MNVTPEDFGDGPLSGIAFQRRLEEAAYAAGGGGYLAPAQRVEDFLQKALLHRPRTGHPQLSPQCHLGQSLELLPPFVAQALAEALPILGQKLRGYDAPDAVLTAVESQLLSGADSSGRGVSVLHPGTGPLRGGSRLRRRHPLRRHQTECTARAAMRCAAPQPRTHSNISTGEV